MSHNGFLNKEKKYIYLSFFFNIVDFYLFDDLNVCIVFKMVLISSIKLDTLYNIKLN